ncbi:MAG: efflux RND transporter periplasmic adaptor subunit [Gammaproteobacteria bacterium]|jgi:membrane fusion protein (multidrug efflux system)|nr:efflux RND transporter periplasmic adaptor subunit [Gammaproteobacteria bacterium]MBT4075958.1 efflux RND transporter periplasmic adaptor subunit [Gammaproteobacteria bacterium]MBT4193359.1 efflux RND transporter periplasmic adaptor subunit [Gammaproteobacteria bacterium]MBT4451023.1 efflux RND transporter periplasmic adaptor subunit [Gammaproteobacteria bacterium]MBT4859941.1 efflux RND transporter periplasmic adaptor subunit [Gammaproteobacteria bacterium]
MRLNQLVFIFSLFLLTACDSFSMLKDDEKKEAAAPAPQPVSVTSVTVNREDIPVHYEFVGQVAGSLELEVRSRITGIIEQRHYKEGSYAKAGDLLFSLDDAPFKAEFKQALAAIELAKAQKVTAQAQLKQAERELKRVTPLARNQMVSQNQLDDANSAVDIAIAQQAVADATIKQAEANLLSAQINLDYTRIKAPIDGITGRALKNRGALVQVGSDSLLTTQVQTDSVHINFGIPENDQLRIRRELSNGSLKLPETGFTVDLLDESGNSSGYSGVIDFKDYKVDNSTGNFAMRASINNSQGSLSPGQFVRVQLKSAVKVNAIALPQRAILDNPEGKYVYVASPAENGMKIALQKKVVPGEWVDMDESRKNYWIIRSGLEVGDEVIVDGVARIFFPGMPVKIDDSVDDPAVVE